MIAAVYFLPVIACLVLHLAFGYNGDRTTYMWILLAGEATVAAAHKLAYSRRTNSTEYLGSLVTGIFYEEPWTELVTHIETRTDRNGRTYTVRKIRHHHHSEIFYFTTTTGKTFNTGEQFFCDVRDQWQLPRHSDRWTGCNIRGGVRYGCHYSIGDMTPEQFDTPKYWIPITETNSYKNKIRCSNSIFKFEKISSEQAKAIGLFDYPDIYGYDAPCILPGEFELPFSVDSMFRRFNARYAPEVQMRLYILLFPADKGIAISEMQRAYWQGGNKNELVVCIGLTAESDIAWARAFSWADEQTVEADIAQWLMKHRRLDWQEFHNWLTTRIADWRRKEFADFDYINVTLPLSSFLLILALSILENALAIYLAVKP